ncbi:MAG: type II secretion system F family protein [Alkalimonas sp.]|nr:type II secretion system F family protein [Alkalimonas sp.]
MAEFHYSARDQQGKPILGKMEASSESSVADALRQRQLVPVTIEAKAEPGKGLAVELWQRRVSLTELIMFCRQMYALMKAGIPMIRAIEGLALSTHSSRLKQVLSQLGEELEKGRTLSVAMSTHPKVFNRLMISIVHVGENTGRLDEAFQQLTDYFEQEQETRKQIKQATRYPTFVLLALAVAMVILNLLVIPQFATMFARFNAELPWSTQVLLATSSFFQTFWWLLAIATVGGFFLLRYSIETDSGRVRWGRIKLRMPLVGDIIKRATLGRYARSFGLMLKAGVPMTTALSLVADAVDNAYLGEKIREMRRKIERGESLYRVTVQSGMFTPLVLQMVAVGEETGQMDAMLHEVAGFYEREVAYDLKTLTARIEPILIAIVAAMVLILALGIFTPMWDMLSAYRGNN